MRRVRVRACMLAGCLIIDTSTLATSETDFSFSFSSLFDVLECSSRVVLRELTKFLRLGINSNNINVVNEEEERTNELITESNRHLRNRHLIQFGIVIVSLHPLRDISIQIQTNDFHSFYNESNENFVENKIHFSEEIDRHKMEKNVYYTCAL